MFTLEFEKQRFHVSFTYKLLKGHELWLDLPLPADRAKGSGCKRPFHSLGKMHVSWLWLLPRRDRDNWLLNRVSSKRTDEGFLVEWWRPRTESYVGTVEDKESVCSKSCTF